MKRNLSSRTQAAKKCVKNMIGILGLLYYGYQKFWLFTFKAMWADTTKLFMLSALETPLNYL